MATLQTLPPELLDMILSKFNELELLKIKNLCKVFRKWCQLYCKNQKLIITQQDFNEMCRDKKYLQLIDYMSLFRLNERVRPHNSIELACLRDDPVMLRILLSKCKYFNIHRCLVDIFQYRQIKPVEIIKYEECSSKTVEYVISHNEPNTKIADDQSFINNKQLLIDDNEGCINDNERIFKYISYKSMLNINTSKCYDIYSICRMCRNIMCFEILFKQLMLSVNSYGERYDFNKLTAILHDTCKYGHMHGLLRILYLEFGRFRKKFQTKDVESDIEIALYKACENNYLDCVKILITFAHQNNISISDTIIMDCIKTTCRYGYPEIMKYLFEICPNTRYCTKEYLECISKYMLGYISHIGNLNKKERNRYRECALLVLKYDVKYYQYLKDLI